MHGLVRWLGCACRRAGDDLGVVKVGGDEGSGTLRGEGVAAFIDLAPPLRGVRLDAPDPRCGGDARA